jgi:ribonuclease HII
LLTCDPTVHYGISIISAAEIDQLNILQATLKAMHQAVEALDITPDCLLIDGNHAIAYQQVAVEAVIGGDGKSLAIAAASILAKETRDRLMLELHQSFPHYGFDRHKGYGTAQHLAALKLHGPSPIHRFSFAPLRNNE